MTLPRRRPSKTAAVLAVAATALAVLSTPAFAAKDAGAWDKPGVPLDGQQHADPSAVNYGRLVVSSATQHGGADLPVIWSSDLQTWIARNIMPGDEHRDGDAAGYFNDAIDSPAWGPYSSCTETKANKSGCDPKELWAPGFAFVGNQWVSYSAVKISDSAKYSSYGRFAIYRATASTPFGLYSSVSKNPIVSSDKTKDPAGVLDPEVFVDQSSPTKQPYLLYKTEGNKQGNYPALWSRKLTPSGTAFASGSKPVKLLTVTRSRAWEGRVIENPSMIKANGKYILFYSANDYPTSRYTTAYAVCKTPSTASCTKPKDGRLLKSVTGSYGPGGADALTDDSGRNLLMYHAYPSVNGTRGVGGRQPRVAQFAVDAAGKVTITRRVVTPGAGTDGQTWYGGPGASFSVVKKDVPGNYTPFVTDLDADGTDDVALYGMWNRANAALLGNTGRTPLTDADATDPDFGEQKGAFEPITGDFNGDGLQDIYWYEPGGTSPFLDHRSSRYETAARPESIWFGSNDGFSRWKKFTLSQDRVAIPIVGNFDGGAADEIYWYAPGTGTDETWKWIGGDTFFSRSTATIPGLGTAQPRVGDLDGNGFDDILWYEAGSPTATVWWDGKAAGATTFPVDTVTQNGNRRPVIGDFDGDGKAEILWYGPGTVPETLWSGFTKGTGAPASVSTPQQLDGSDVYQPLVGDFDHDGVDDIYWYG